MKDNDFLDDLYSNSAKDVPPESLDQAILKHARDNVQKGNFLMRRQWQQFLSLAAVMVLSVYVVLDVGDESMDVEGLSLSEEPSPSGNEMRAKAESFKIKEAKRIVRDELMPLSVQENVPQHAQQNSRDLAIELKEITVQGSEEVDGTHAGNSLKVSPEKMMEEVERLIHEGELAKAKILFQQISETYPEFPVSIRIIEALK